MSVNKEPIKRIKNDHNEIEERHPSFAMARISSISYNNGISLFGSNVKNDLVVELEIKKAHKYVEFGYDQHSSAGEELIASIIMTNSQFVELITTSNRHSGIPVTLKYHKNGDTVSVPEIDMSNEISEVERASREFIRKNESIIKYFKSKKSEIEEILSKRSISKSDRERISSIFQEVSSWLENTSPWVVQNFIESMEKNISKAKIEIDSFVTHIVNMIGIDALKNLKLLDKKK